MVVVLCQAGLWTWTVSKTVTADFYPGTGTIMIGRAEERDPTIGGIEPGMDVKEKLSVDAMVLGRTGVMGLNALH